MRFCALIIGLVLGGVFTFRPSLAQPQPLAPQALTPQQWASTYLFNSLFLLEYAMVEDLKNQVNQRLPTQEELLKHQKRAQFAFATMKQLEQYVPFKLPNSLSLPKRPLPAQEWAQALTDIGQSLASPLQQRLWPSIAALYTSHGLSSPCSAPPNLAENYQAFCASAHQLRMALEKVFTPSLSQASKQQFVNNFLAGGGLSAGKQLEFKLLGALWHLFNAHYPSTLQILWELQEKEAHFRLAYEQVQRLYSSHAKGSGKVALQNL